jgi:hypothetical protein
MRKKRDFQNRYTPTFPTEIVGHESAPSAPMNKAQKVAQKLRDMGYSDTDIAAVIKAKQGDAFLETAEAMETLEKPLFFNLPEGAERIRRGESGGGGLIPTEFSRETGIFAITDPETGKQKITNYRPGMRTPGKDAVTYARTPEGREAMKQLHARQLALSGATTVDPEKVAARRKILQDEYEALAKALGGIHEAAAGNILAEDKKTLAEVNRIRQQMDSIKTELEGLSTRPTVPGMPDMGAFTPEMESLQELRKPWAEEDIEYTERNELPPEERTRHAARPMTPEEAVQPPPTKKGKRSRPKLADLTEEDPVVTGIAKERNISNVEALQQLRTDVKRTHEVARNIQDPSQLHRFTVAVSNSDNPYVKEAAREGIARRLSEEAARSAGSYYPEEIVMEAVRRQGPERAAEIVEDMRREALGPNKDMGLKEMAEDWENNKRAIGNFFSAFKALMDARDTFLARGNVTEAELLGKSIRDTMESIFPSFTPFPWKGLELYRRFMEKVSQPIYIGGPLEKRGEGRSGPFDYNEGSPGAL